MQLLQLLVITAAKADVCMLAKTAERLAQDFSWNSLSLTTPTPSHLLSPRPHFLRYNKRGNHFNDSVSLHPVDFS